MRLVSRALESDLAKISERIGQLQQNQRGLSNQRERTLNLSLKERDQIDSELSRTATELSAAKQELELLESLEQDLFIKAAHSGTVTSWDMQNALLGSPVQVGDLLLSTYDSESDWRLQIAIPERQLGIVQAAMQQSPTGLPVKFTLNGQPSATGEARLQHTAYQTAWQSTLGNEECIVYGFASMPSEQLPLKKDGAFAEASIACGQVPLIWLFTRDVYWAIRSAIQLSW